MIVKYDVKLIEELEIALTYYIKGLMVNGSEERFIFDIQRMTEHSLVEYTKLDLIENNFLKSHVSIVDSHIEIDFTHSKEIKQVIKIRIPCFKLENTKRQIYNLSGKVKVEVF